MKGLEEADLLSDDEAETNSEEDDDEAGEQTKEPEIKLVVPPSDPGNMNVFDCKNEKVQELVKRASQMQDRRVADNNRTKYFAYKRTEVDMLELRLCMIVSGLKMPESAETMSARMTIGSLLKNYSWAERHRARELKRKIKTETKEKTDSIYINYVYVTVGFWDNEKNDFNVSDNPVFILQSGKFMDTGARVYDNWDHYLKTNDFKQGLMIYPENGTYTPTDSNDNPLENVQLVARETPSCQPSAVVKKYLDVTVSVVGIGLTVVSLGTAAVVAVPMMSYTVATLTAISTGSAWIGTSCTVYTVATGGYDKLRHGQSVATEMLLAATALYTGLTARSSSAWSKKMAECARTGDAWDDVVLGISKSERWLFTTINLLKVASTASTVMSAVYRLWAKDNRTWMDYAQLCIALYYFTNTITKPITLQGVFETEQGHMLRNHFSHKFKNKIAKAKYEETMAKATTPEQKAYLIRNLREIRDLDDYFYRVHRYNTHVDYTADGLVIDNQLRISPRAYNLIGEEYLMMQLNDISVRETIEMREKLVKKLIEDYGGSKVKKKFPGLEEDLNKYVRGKLSEKQTKALANRIKDIGKYRRDQLFEDLKNYRDTGSYRNIREEMERKMNDGQTLDEMQAERAQLKQKRLSGSISQEEYDRRLPEMNRRIERGVNTRRIVDNYARPNVNDRGNNPQKLKGDFMRNQADGKTAEQWKKEADNQEKLLNMDPDKPPEGTNQNLINRARQIRDDPQLNQEIEERIKHARRMEGVARQADSISFEDFEGIRNRYRAMENYARNERFMFILHEDNLHMDIEQMFGVSDYRNATVGGRRIFENMSTNEIDRMSRMLSELGPNRDAVVEMARRLAEDDTLAFFRNNNQQSDQNWNAMEFANLLGAVRQARDNLSPSDNQLGQFTAADDGSIRDDVNRMLQEVREAHVAEGQAEFSSDSSAAVHADKHRDELHADATTQEYLDEVANVIRNENATGVVFTQDGRAIRVNYGLTEGGRYRFGVSSTNIETQEIRVLTTFSPGERGTTAPNVRHRLPIRRPQIVYHLDVECACHDMSWWKGPFENEDGGGPAAGNNLGSGGGVSKPKNTGNEGGGGGSREEAGTGSKQKQKPVDVKKKSDYNKYIIAANVALLAISLLPIGPKVPISSCRI